MKINGHRVSLHELQQYVPELPEQLPERVRGEVSLSQAIHPYVWQLYHNDPKFKAYMQAVTNEQSESGNTRYDDAYSVPILLTKVREAKDTELLNRLNSTKAVKIGGAIPACLGKHNQRRTQRLAIAKDAALAALTAHPAPAAPAE